MKKKELYLYNSLIVIFSTGQLQVIIL